MRRVRERLEIVLPNRACGGRTGKSLEFPLGLRHKLCAVENHVRGHLMSVGRTLSDSVVRSLMRLHLCTLLSAADFLSTSSSLN